MSYQGISGLYNNNSIDGADDNQAFFSEANGRTRTPYAISQSNIKEFQVGLSNYSAEFGRAAGGTVNAVTKSGTNDFHGEGFYFLRSKGFIAMDPLIKAAGKPKPDERRQQFGCSAGGPIIKDKVFFFGNYDQQLHFQVVWEGFNLFNRVNYTSFLLTQYRVASSSLAGKNATVTLAPPSGSPFLTPSAASSFFTGPREFQLGLKFVW